MKIIEARPAPNPRRVRIFLAEKGIDMEFERISLMEGDHKRKPFTDLNPRRSVPVLVLDDGTPICETVAICRYFEEMQPEPVLMGKDALSKAQVEMWQRWVEIDLLRTVLHVFRHTNERSALLQQPQFHDWGEANRPAC